MLTQLTLTDFKAFHERTTVQLRPITVLIGPNNSGKSSVLAAIRLLAQTLQSRDPGLPLLLDGALGDFGTYRDLVHGNHRGRPMHIELEASSNEGSHRIALEYKYRTVRRELVLRESKLTSKGHHLITANMSNDYSRYLVTKLGTTAIPAPNRSAISNLLTIYNFLPRLGFFPRRLSDTEQRRLSNMVPAKQYAELDSEIDEAFFNFVEVLSSVDSIGAMRQVPERTYHQTGAASTKIGSYGENWAGLFVLDSARPARSRQLVPRITKWLKEAGLASDVRLNWLSDRHYEVQVQHPITKEYENLADVGQANSQIIPVLVGGLRLSPGSTFLVEEPEIHLHPLAQGKLGDYFLSLHQQGVATVIETHSEYLILRLQQHVAAGTLSPKDIAFYYVHAGGSLKKLRRLQLDAEGRFDTPLDQGFFPQRLEESRNLALIRKQRRASQ